MKNQNRVQTKNDGDIRPDQDIPALVRNAWSVVSAHVWRNLPDSISARGRLLGKLHRLLPVGHPARRRVGIAQDFLCRHALQQRPAERDHSKAHPWRVADPWKLLIDYLSESMPANRQAAKRLTIAVGRILTYHRPPNGEALSVDLSRARKVVSEAQIQQAGGSSKGGLDFEQREICRRALRFGSDWQDIKTAEHAAEWARDLEVLASRIRANTAPNTYGCDWKGLANSLRPYIASEFELRAQLIRRRWGLPDRPAAPIIRMGQISLAGPENLHSC
jgi:hypothetical protein